MDGINNPLNMRILMNPNLKEGIHHATLSKWVEEMTSKGIDIPDELFGVYIANETKIK